ncbi:DUF899 family protein [Curtobacterium sp. VKM Ac-2852]|uniref:DUF899 family protein n=1 Tax=Curtobacterium sp. VKM Ac-2852 TaxID=2739024 RepID=UPI0020B13A05|nr:DUF899 family protein [Curtobacterium sp. VKM Ac-2852]
MSKLQQPGAAPPVVDRAAFDAALADQVRDEKELTRHGDRVSAARWRLPMVRVDDYAFDGPDGPVHLTELFGDRYLLLVQNVMYSADWDDACPSCTWAIDDLPADMGRLDDEGIAFAMVSEAPVEAEVGCLRPGALERARPEVVHQDVPRPAVLDSGLGVAFPSDGIRLRQERSDVPPRQSVHTLWTN